MPRPQQPQSSPCRDRNRPRGPSPAPEVVPGAVLTQVYLNSLHSPPHFFPEPHPLPVSKSWRLTQHRRRRGSWRQRGPGYCAHFLGAQPLLQVAAPPASLPCFLGLLLLWEAGTGPTMHHVQTYLGRKQVGLAHLSSPTAPFTEEPRWQEH